MAERRKEGNTKGETLKSQKVEKQVFFIADFISIE
jgi:hypothetical protein